MIRGIYFILLGALAYPQAYANTETNAVSNPLYTAAKTYLEQHYRGTYATDHDIQVKVIPMDSRLTLPTCQQPLVFSLRDKHNNGGKVALHTRCPGPKKWGIYLSANVDILAPVLVASHSLERGKQLIESDMQIAKRSLSRLHQGYLQQPQRALNKRLKRNLKPGAIIRLQNLNKSDVINKGDEVTIKATSGAIAIVTSGTALSAGHIGQQINIQNRESARIIRARVVAAGRVEVIL